jgi:hypothetical protein
MIWKGRNEIHHRHGNDFGKENAEKDNYKQAQRRKTRQSLAVGNKSMYGKDFWILFLHDIPPMGIPFPGSPDMLQTNPCQFLQINLAISTNKSHQFSWKNRVSWE